MRPTRSGNKSNTATFAVTVSAAPTAGITGTVFKDTNANGKKDSGESGLSGVTVYLDANKNGVLDSGETKLTTTSTGAYSFSGLAAGSYRVRGVLPTGYKLESPTAGYVDVTVVAGKSVAGPVFADAPATGSISGTVFADSNDDGKFGSTELGLGLWELYIDANNDGKYDAGDTEVTTDVNGNWSFTGLTAGSYTIRIVQVSGTKTMTAGGAVQTITVGAATAVTGKLFGEERFG